ERLDQQREFFRVAVAQQHQVLSRPSGTAGTRLVPVLREYVARQRELVQLLARQRLREGRVDFGRKGIRHWPSLDRDFRKNDSQNGAVPIPAELVGLSF